MQGGVSIQIDGESGQVNSYSLSWHELDFRTRKVINKQKAAQAFSENAFTGEYFVPIYRILTTENNEQIKLVYQLKNNGMLDVFPVSPLI